MRNIFEFFLGLSFSYSFLFYLFTSLQCSTTIQFILPLGMATGKNYTSYLGHWHQYTITKENCFVINQINFNSVASIHILFMLFIFALISFVPMWVLLGLLPTTNCVLFSKFSHYCYSLMFVNIQPNPITVLCNKIRMQLWSLFK